MLTRALLTAATIATCSLVAQADVTIQTQNNNHTLLVDGKPFFIQGVGGGGSKTLLKEIGGNAFRTWGVDELDKQLAEAQRLGLKVAVGIWLEHERHGFSYSDPESVQKQFNRAKAAITKYKDHPAVLLWSIGNEMEGYGAGDDPRIWNAVEAIAKMAKEIDPTHPIMTVVAELGGGRVKSIHDLCPSVDIIGINSYAGCPSIPQRYRALGGTKPYIVTEFGPPGTWEVGKTDWNVAPEPTSTQKAEAYRNSWEKGILAEKDKLCLGAFAFIWGDKQEMTATWFGMLLPDGSRVASTDTMQELWTGKPPADRVPAVNGWTLSADQPKPGATVEATLDVTDPEGKPLVAEWILREEVLRPSTGGDFEVAPAEVEGAILSGDATGAKVKMPDRPGKYRLSVIVRDPNNGAATVNIPLFIAGKPDAAKLATHAQLPYRVYSDEQANPLFVASGWMGKIDAIAMDDKNTDKPKAGPTALKCEFKSATDFGGVVWQAPANDWGDVDGGLDFTGATKLSFWARGEAGGEKVEFKFGIIDKAKPFHDTASGAIIVTLTPDWQKYQIDLRGKDLRRIKTAFAWIVGDPGKPVTFYVDDVQYE